MSDSTVFFGPVSAEEINATQIPPGQMSSHLGIEMLETGTNFMIARMPVDHRTIQRIGILNGGASLALAENSRQHCRLILR